MLFAPSAFAGFGGMANIESEGSVSSDSLSILVFCAIAGAVIGWTYAKYINKSRAEPEKVSLGGYSILGSFSGVLILPFLWILLSK